jgi:hypothetical protein
MSLLTSPVALVIYAAVIVAYELGALLAWMSP